MSDEISAERRFRGFFSTAGWVLAALGLVVAMASSYWPRSDITVNGVVRLDLDAERGYALATLGAILAIAIGGVIGIIAASAGIGRRAGAILLWALGAAAIIASLGLGYRATQTFAMVNGNWLYQDDGNKVGWTTNGTFGFLIPLVAATLLFLAWGICRGATLGLAAAVLVPLATPIAALSTGSLASNDSRHLIFIVVWTVGVVSAAVIASVIEWLRHRPRPLVIPVVTLPAT